ncbi:MAG: YggS family pyridoxal phosphate-dependent enzyme [bacterium]|jgi:pyridoxal phosphate enzyme (YggS family)
MNEPLLESLKTRVDSIRENVVKAAERCGRCPDEIKILAVSKTHPSELIRMAHQAGLRLFGENRVQEAERKVQELRDLDLEWHLIGQLQTNKVKKALDLFRFIHSVDRPRLVNALEREAQLRQQTINIFLQVNIGEEESKAGTSVDHFEELLNSVQQTEFLHVLGLMTVPPFLDDPAQVRPYFQQLRELGEKYRADLVGNRRLELSMGMTHDYPVAIEEGATILRIGTAIFGER